MSTRPAGLRAIIAYKLVKSPLMFALAIWMTVAPLATSHFAIWLTHELAGGGALLRRLSHWLALHVTATVIERARVVAWFDAFTTALEAWLLWRGKSWGEWLVVGGLGVACVFELLSIGHRPTLLKSIVFFLNVVIVVYLAHRRVTLDRAAHRSLRLSRASSVH